MGLLAVTDDTEAFLRIEVAAAFALGAGLPLIEALQRSW
jgi:hypothetical protein